jgi:hypothetical protein
LVHYFHNSFFSQNNIKISEIHSLPFLKVERGDPAVFEAHADGVPAPEFQWSIGGRRVFPSTEGAAVQLDPQNDGLCRLTIDTNKFPESAPVQLNVSNPLGSDECSARLIVVEPLPGPPFKKGRYTSEDEESESQVTQLLQPKNGGQQDLAMQQQQPGLDMAQPMEGVEVKQQAAGAPSFPKGGLAPTLECRPAEDLVVQLAVDGADRVNWSKDGQPLEDGVDGTRIEQKLAEGISQLTLPNMQPEKGGTLKVEAENEKGRAESQAQIRVLPATAGPPGAPHFQQQLTNAEVPEGESVEFSAVVQG